MSGQVFLGWTITKPGLMCLAQGHNAMTQVRLEPVALPSRVEHSTTEPLPSSHLDETKKYLETLSFVKFMKQANLWDFDI